MFLIVSTLDYIYMHSWFVWVCHYSIINYCNISKIRSWVMNLSGSSKRGVGIFLRVVIFLLKIHPPHTQLVSPYLCTLLQCFSFLALAYAITASGVCLHLLVPPLAQCCFFGASCCMYYGINRWMYFERKARFATASFKKAGWAYFERLW